MLGTLQMLFKGIVIPVPSVNLHVVLNSSFVFKKGTEQADTFWPPQSFIDLCSFLYLHFFISLAENAHPRSPYLVNSDTSISEFVKINWKIILTDRNWDKGNISIRCKSAKKNYSNMIKKIPFPSIGVQASVYR